MKRKKLSFSNDEIYLATILGAMQKIDIYKAIENKDLGFKENVYAVLEDFCDRFGSCVNDSAVLFSHDVPDVERLED